MGDCPLHQRNLRKLDLKCYHNKEYTQFLTVYSTSTFQGIVHTVSQVCKSSVHTQTLVHVKLQDIKQNHRLSKLCSWRGCISNWANKDFLWHSCGQSLVKVIVRKGYTTFFYIFV